MSLSSDNNATEEQLLLSFDEQSALFHDITIDLSVEVGRTKMKISELLNLTKDSVIVLDQKPEDPLIIYANDKAIAKGQIISSNGKFSLQIL